jgi:hypothetical protein
MRWRIERDYQELKQELGLGHYEERGWSGLHHHITLRIAAYGFLIAERAISPPRTPKTQQFRDDWRFRWSPIRRHSRCVPSDIFRTPSLRSGGGLLSPWSGICRDVRGAAYGKQRERN